MWTLTWWFPTFNSNREPSVSRCSSNMEIPLTRLLHQPPSDCLAHWPPPLVRPQDGWNGSVLSVPLSLSVSLSLFWSGCSDVFFKYIFHCSQHRLQSSGQRETSWTRNSTRYWRKWKKRAPQNELLLPTLRPQHTHRPCDSHFGLLCKCSNKEWLATVFVLSSLLNNKQPRGRFEKKYH